MGGRQPSGRPESVAQLNLPSEDLELPLRQGRLLSEVLGVCAGPH